MRNEYIRELIEKLYQTEICIEKKCKDYNEGIELLVNVFKKYRDNNARVFFIGNGGSSAIASHMTADFMKNGGMKAYNLYDTAVTTCIGNDYGYEYIFSKQMEFLTRGDDLITAISSSGNSQNIINAIEIAKEKGAAVITFTGFEPDNKARRMADIGVYVPSYKYGIVESIHNIILQQIVDMIAEKESND